MHLKISLRIYHSVDMPEEYALLKREIRQNLIFTFFGKIESALFTTFFESDIFDLIDFGLKEEE